jgi:RNA polymerase sigma-70 factor (ECF subfamily)
VVRSIAVEQASVRATADKLAMSEGAVRVALHRGLTTLAARLRED